MVCYLVLLLVPLASIVGYVYGYINWADILSQTDEEKVDYCWNNFHNKATDKPMSQAICQDEMNKLKDMCFSHDDINQQLLSAKEDSFEIVERNVTISEEAKEAKALFDKYWK